MNGGTHRVAAASYVQRAMWINAQRQRKAALNVMVFGWRLKGRIERAVLHDALNDVIRRHEALRTRLELRGGHLLQVIEPGCELQLESISVPGGTADERWHSALAVLRNEASRPIDVSAVPAIRARLVPIAEDDHVLCLFVHHAMCDGWSSQVMMRDLAAFYEGRVEGRHVDLPAPAEQYADFAEAQIRDFENGRFAEELAYWKRELAGLPDPVELPTKVPRRGNRDWEARSPTATCPAPVLSALRKYARSRRVSLFSTTLAAFATLVHRTSGVRDMLIGVSITNRWTHASLDMVGCLTNMLPARIRIEPTITFDALVGQVHATTRRLLAYGKVPLELVMKEMREPLALGLGLPLWCGVRELAAPVLLQQGALCITPLLLERGTVLADLDVDLVQTTGDLECVFAYRRSLFDEESMATMLGAYLRMLQRVDACSGRSVTELGTG